ncbi:ribonuclease H-like domain-containing protein [Tanacetum coccineum]
MESQSETTQKIYALKLPMLKTGDYDLWSMRMEQYLTHTDHALWEVIMNGDAPATIASASAGAEGPIPPKTAEQKLARKNELKAKSTLLLAIPDEHLLKFHGIKDAKTLWEAIKTRFGGNKESKKIQKTILKQQYKNFDASRSEDANLKFLRSLPSAWNTHTLIMRNKSDLDTLSMDDLYNNLKVYEAEIKGQSSSSSNSQNVAFVSSDNTSSTNEAVNTAHDVSAASSQGQASASTYADDVMFSFFANQSNSPLLDNEDLEQIDTDDLEEMDLKWQVAMLTMRVKRFINKTGSNLNFNGKETVGFDKTKVECYNCHRRGHFARECRAPRNRGNRNGESTRRVVPVETPANALVVTDEMGYDWSYQAEEGPTDFALIAHSSSGSSSSSSSDTEREVLNKANPEIIAYQLGLESLEARIVVHQKNEVVFEEDIAFLKYDVKCFEMIFMYKAGVGYHAVPPPYTGNFMPLRPNLSFAGLDDSVFKSKVSETITSVPKIETTASKTSKECMEKPTTVRSYENTRKSVIKQHTYRQAENLRKSKSPKGITKEKLVWFNNVTTAGSKAVVSTVERNRNNDVKSSTCWIWRPKGKLIDHISKDKWIIYTPKRFTLLIHKAGLTSDQVDFLTAGSSRHIVGGTSHISQDYQEIDGDLLHFGGEVLKRSLTFSPDIIKCVTRKNSVLSLRPDEVDPECLFAIEFTDKNLRIYEPVTAGNQTNGDACIETNVNAGKARPEKASDHEYIMLPFMPSNSPLSSSTQSSDDKDTDEVPCNGDEGVPFMPSNSPLSLSTQSSDDKDINEVPCNGDEGVNKGDRIDDQEKTDSSTQDVNTAGPNINTANANINTGSPNINIVSSNDPSMPSLEETGIFDDVYDDREVGAEADKNNLELSTVVSHIPTTRVHKDHPKEQIIGDLNLST